MMTDMQQSPFAAAKLTPWSGLLRRLPLQFSLALAHPRAGAAARHNVELASCARPMAPPAWTSRLDPVRHATMSTTPRQARAMLRVVRILETDQGSASGGRMMMCGRMVDVCAELDRMIEREAAQLAGA